MKNIEKELKYLKILSKQYPSISKASTEIHGEYEAFVHVLKNGSGVIKRKIEELFSSTIRESEKKTLATLVYYPEQKLALIEKEEDNIDDFYRIYIYR